MSRLLAYFQMHIHWYRDIRDSITRCFCSAGCKTGARKSEIPRSPMKYKFRIARGLNYGRAGKNGWPVIFPFKMFKWFSGRARIYIYAAAKYFLTAAEKEKEEAQEAGQIETNNECDTKWKSIISARGGVPILISRYERTRLNDI